MKGERIITSGGRQFVERKLSELSSRDVVERKLAEVGFNADGDQLVRVPYHPPDDKLEFPSNAPLDDDFIHVGSGLAAHSVEREKGQTAREGVGFAATDLMLFSSIDWHGECFLVLDAHGWLGPGGGLSDTIVSKVTSIYGEAEIELAKKHYRENWESYVGELAAVHFAKPLSRLWYAANMLSLYYAHYDDLRLGFLWAEYQIRMRHEPDAVRGKKSVAGAQVSGVARSQKYEELRSQVIQCMVKSLANGQSVKNAAALTFKKGLGKSAEANRKLFQRHYREKQPR